MASKLWGFAALFAGIALSAGTGGASLLGIAPGFAAAVTPWLWGATIGFGLIASNVASREARKAANASLQDRVTPIRATDEPRAILYGRQRVGGVVTYVSPPYGTRKERVTIVQTLVGHPCDAVETIWVNDEPVTIDSSGYVTGSASGKWVTKVNDMRAVPTTAPALWDAGTPGSNRLAAPTGTNGIVSVIYTPAAGDVARQALEGIDYVVIPNSFDIGNIGLAPGVEMTVTYRGAFVLDGFIRVRTFTGYETGDARRDLDLETNSGGEWASTATGDGLCRMHIELAYNETMFADGLPSFSAVVRGKRVYDPRLDSTLSAYGGSGSCRADDPTTWIWRRLAALSVADYLMSDWGFGVPASRIDWALVIAAANHCDETIRVDATDPTRVEPQFTTDGFISTSQPLGDNLDELCAAMAGFAAPSGSTWRIMAGAWTAPAADSILTDTDVVGDVEIVSAMSAAEVFNSVRGRYRDESTWQITDMVPYSSATYVADDGGVKLWRDIDLPLTLNQFRAQRLAKLTLFRARAASVVFSGTFGLAAWKYQIGDRLRLRLTEYGWDTVSQDSGTGKVFRVIDRAWVYPDQVRLPLVDDAEAIYEVDFDEWVASDPTPNTTLPSSSDVEQPFNFEGSASASDFFVAPDGATVGYLLLNWDAITDSSVLAGGWLEIRWKRAHEQDFRTIRVQPFATEHRLEGMRKDELLNIGILAVNASQARSSLTLIEGNVASANLANGLFSVETAFLTGSGGTVWSGNLLQNATFQFDLEGWGVDYTATTYASSTFKPGPPYALDGPPVWNVLIVEDGAGGVGSTAGQAYLRPDFPIKVVAGDQHVATAKIMVENCDALVGLVFYNASGVPVGTSYSSTFSQATVGDPSVLASYESVSVYAEAPAGALSARPYFIKLGTKTGTYSRMYVAGPVLSEFVGAESVPPFNVGAQGAVTTPSIALGAATDVIRGTPAAASLALEWGETFQYGGLSIPGRSMTSVTFTPEDSGTVELVINGTGKFTTPANTGVGLKLTVLVYDVAHPQGTAIYARQIAQCPTRSYAYEQAFSVSLDVDVVQGNPVTFLPVINLTIDQLVTPTIGSPSIENFDMKIVLIKR